MASSSAVRAEATRLLDEHGTRLREIAGVGPVLAARILGRTGHVGRFATAAAYATYNGTAPVEIASAEHQGHRLNRYGDRQLNSLSTRSPSSSSACLTAPGAARTTAGSPAENGHERRCAALIKPIAAVTASGLVGVQGQRLGAPPIGVAAACYRPS
jgi:hypothetical protein